MTADMPSIHNIIYVYVLKFLSIDLLSVILTIIFVLEIIMHTKTLLLHRLFGIYIIERDFSY